MNGALAITGATGKKSGGYFAHVLCEHKDEINDMFHNDIRVLIRKESNTSYLDTASLHFEKYIGSLNDDRFLREAFEGVDTVINIAGINFSRAIVKAAVDVGVRRLILIHTTGIFSKYKAVGEEYRKIDKYCYDTVHNRLGDMVLTILRPTMIYGNVHDNNVIKFIKMVDKYPIMAIVNGARYELQPVHYKDLGLAYYQVLMNEKTTSNKDFNLSGEKPIMLREILLKIFNELGKEPRFLNVPFPLAYYGSVLLNILTLNHKDYREKVQRLCESRIFSHSDATNAFGYSPRSFDEGIKDEVIQYNNLKAGRT